MANFKRIMIFLSILAFLSLVDLTFNWISFIPGIGPVGKSGVELIVEGVQLVVTGILFLVGTEDD